MEIGEYISRVERMEQMSEDESVVFRAFLKKYKNNKNKYIFLLEGIDDLDYYLPVFESKVGSHNDNWIDLVCYGKENVFQLVGDLQQHSQREYQDSLYFGFVDKDYHEVSDNIYPDRIYVTPTYSIENFYVSLTFFKKILMRKFHLSEDDPENNDFNLCCDNFQSRMNDFVSGVKELDSLLRCNRIMYEEKRITSKINARDINLNDMISVSLGSITIKNNALNILSKTIEDFDPDALNVARYYYEGKSESDLAKVVRGKFMFFFIHQYLFRLKEDNLKRMPVLFPDSYALSRRPREERKVFTKTKISITREAQDILSDLCQFADVPSCLVGFLNVVLENVRPRVPLAS
ncbi:TPA: DUF4435 domain-containing protein [Enterobacter bugandensis]